MTKHIFDTTRERNGAIKSAHYVRIDATERRQPQSKALHQQPKPSNPLARTRRFLDMDRRQNA